MQAIGNDVIDLYHPSILDHSDIFQGGGEEWMQRHLTAKEWRWLQELSTHQQRGLSFWQMFALKEACSKAVTQLGYTVPSGGFTHFQTDFERNVVLHYSGEELIIQNLQTNRHRIHAVVASSSGDFKVFSEVHHLTDGEDASWFLQDRLLKSLKCNGYESTTFAQKDGIPFVIRNGKSVAPVSFSHSGRFAAFSWLSQNI